MLLLLFGMTSTETDSGFSPDACLCRISRGEKEALEELYTNMGGAVYGYALSVLKDHHGAQDVQQEVFIKIWACATQYRAGSNAKAWIFTIARNLALSALRRSSRISSGELPDIPYSDASAEDRLTLQALLDVLGDDERQLVMLHSSGMKHREIASVMQMPLSTVLSKYNRALKKLKKCLER